MKMAPSTVLVVGSDKLGNLPAKLYARGVAEIIHWDGRNKRVESRPLPKRIDMVMVICDRVSHRLMHSVKRQSKASRIPIVFTDAFTAEFKDIGKDI